MAKLPKRDDFPEPDDRQVSLRTSATARARDALTGVKGLAALVTAMVTLVGAVGWIAHTFYSWRSGQTEAEPERPSRTEEKRLSRLEAGVTFTAFRRILGGEPRFVNRLDRQFDNRPVPGRPLVRYVFVRRYDYVQAVVDRSSKVVGFSVISRSNDLHPRFARHTKPIVLGRTRISFRSEKAGGFCGASRVQYFAEFGGSNVDNAQEFAIGVTSAGVNDRQLSAEVCSAGEVLRRCTESGLAPNTVVTGGFDECIDRSSKARILRSLRVNTYAETAPTIAMFSALLVPVEVQDPASGIDEPGSTTG
jgi:hypothetical protein